MIYPEEVKEVKNENGEVWIKINDGERFRLGEDFLVGFLKENTKSELDNALTILNSEEVKKALEFIVEHHSSNGKIIKGLLNNLEFFGRYVPELKERIRDRFDAFADSMDLNPEEIYEIARQLGLEDELEDHVLDRIRHATYYGGDLEGEVNNILKEALFFAKIYPNTIRKFATNKADEVLDVLNRHYYLTSIEKGRGYCLRDFAVNIAVAEKLRDFLSEEKIQAIQAKLIENIELIKKIIKRRSKLKHHQSYLKAIVSFLPDSYKTQLISYFI
jgi:hypothetical protein